MKHPIINNLILLFISVLLIVPFTLSCIDIYTDYKNSLESNRNNQTVAYIEVYKPMVDINGNAYQYRTTLSYSINNQNYKTTIATTYPVAYAGQSIIVYYEDGNPYNVSPKITVERVSLQDKVKLVLIMLILTLVAFIVKTLNDVDKAYKYKNELKLRKQEIKNEQEKRKW